MEFCNFHGGEMGLRRTLCCAWNTTKLQVLKLKEKKSKTTKVNVDVNDPLFSTITLWKKTYLYYIVTLKVLVQCYLETVINTSLKDFWHEWAFSPFTCFNCNVQSAVNFILLKNRS